MCVEPVVAGAEPHQDHLLLSGQKVVVILLCPWPQEGPDDTPLLFQADAVVWLVFHGTRFRQFICPFVSEVFGVCFNPMYGYINLKDKKCIIIIRRIYNY